MRRTPRTRRDRTPRDRTSGYRTSGDRTSGDRPQVVAHRGSSHETAEHTLAAYVKALDEGADALECDVRLTADGHLVCVHDRDLRRTTSTPGIVSTMNLAELDELDFVSWTNPWSDLDDLDCRCFGRCFGLVRHKTPSCRSFSISAGPKPLMAVLAFIAVIVFGFVAARMAWRHPDALTIPSEGVKS